MPDSSLKFSEPRFDGHIFIGVTTTKIYCRPLCRARKPKPENRLLFVTPAAAEREGFRPCLLCRPELAPGTVPVGAGKDYLLAHRVAGFMEETLAALKNFKEVARHFGLAEAHLRQLFEKAYRVSPEEYLKTARLLLAKQLFTDTTLLPAEIAVATGFSSGQRLKNLFKKEYRLDPLGLRKKGASSKEEKGAIALSLTYRPPYLWENLIDFFAGRTITGAECVKDGEYWRTVNLKSREGQAVRGWFKVGHGLKINALWATIDRSLLPVLPQVLYKIRQLFDLDCDPEKIYEDLLPMNDLMPGLCQPGTRRPGCFEPFEMAVRAVLGQQVTVKAASTLAARFNQALGEPLKTGLKGLDLTFPAPATVLELEGQVADRLGGLGIIGRRSETIKELARAVHSGSIDFSFNLQPEAEVKKLLALPGIGDWTAHYIAMRAMSWADAFLYSDYGVKKVLTPRTPKEILALAEAWRPWRTYANINLWNYRALKNI